ncbi:MAG: TrkA family potassium uptake protein [Flavobacteriaceae bacterium]|nr:TrkA family potassium uptake protein [Flavobacteriaceae bacterium]
MAKDFVVIGLGTFGYEVAKQLFKQGHNVMAIDKNAITIHNIQDYVTIAINTDISDTAVIDELELYNYNKIILGLGSNLEALILTIAYLKNKGAKYIISKANTELQKQVLLKIGADEVILPEKEVAFKLAEKLNNPNFLDKFVLDNNILLMNVKVPPKFDNKTLQELDLRNKYNITVLIRKHEGKSVVINNAKFILNEGDEIFVAGEEKDINKLFN